MPKFVLFAAPLLFIAHSAFAQDVPAETPAPAPETAHKPATQRVIIETTRGDITLALETERAPITAANFLRYADEDRFDGTVFYRAMKVNWGDQPNGLLQGGTQNDPKRILDPIEHEPTTDTGLSHTRGAISMARFAPGTATGDFSIMLGEMTGLDAHPEADNDDAKAGFAVFGHVVDGMDVVENIFNSAIDPEKGEGFLKGQMLAEPVEILDVHRVETDEADEDQPTP
ncbi:peptidylprolyl isomerase [Altericroceibacterium spongiae]|uniref:peptidylprolyl isomerase n=1 Tax=Altericroceibacterium spongiae TaxID=2320269 RepID=A0A420EF34_9SPHN|nr:peptidylprolyl isomerase [Altericroceibacterium spongiae]RKF19292.1 peptidylprolyl isomerase [Altericroceibacterium spongiae]